jgi:hypothetical protein
MLLVLTSDSVRCGGRYALQAAADHNQNTEYHTYIYHSHACGPRPRSRLSHDEYYERGNHDRRGPDRAPTFGHGQAGTFLFSLCRCETMSSSSSTQPHVNIYGPAGLRRLIRITLQLTSVTLSGVYAVHELLPADVEGSAPCGESDLHVNEGVGEDLVADRSGVWENIVSEGGGPSGKGWSVSAGPIEHRGKSALKFALRCGVRS